MMTTANKFIRALLAMFIIFFAADSFASADDEEGLKREIGQMIIIGFRGTEAGPDSDIRRVIREVKIGGVILFDIDVPSGRTFPRNITDPAQTKKLIADLKKDLNIPLFISVDAEGGKVNRLKPKYGFPDIPGAQEVGDKNDITYTRSAADSLASGLSDLGFNMDFAPVVDVNVEPDNPVIGGLGRAFSRDPEVVAEHAAVYVESAREKNIISVLKHFPGHGSSTKDSHLGLVDVTGSYKEEELIPYEILIGDGQADCVMAAHIMDRRVDKDHPASLSPYFIKRVLRERLGFEGVVISDDIQMEAIASHYALPEAVVLAVNAGCDLILAGNNGREYDEDLPYKIRDAIFEGVKNGKIPRERIREAAGRIDALKKRYLSGQDIAI
jgi:beta-N-acetylhexosaminidase